MNSSAISQAVEPLVSSSGIIQVTKNNIAMLQKLCEEGKFRAISTNTEPRNIIFLRGIEHIDLQVGDYVAMRGSRGYLPGEYNGDEVGAPGPAMPIRSECEALMTFNGNDSDCTSCHLQAIYCICTRGFPVGSGQITL
jgi:hypothetical protein